jgi:hypothetical protein
MTNVTVPIPCFCHCIRISLLTDLFRNNLSPSADTKPNYLDAQSFRKLPDNIRSEEHFLKNEPSKDKEGHCQVKCRCTPSLPACDLHLPRRSICSVHTKSQPNLLKQMMMKPCRFVNRRRSWSTASQRVANPVLFLFAKNVLRIMQLLRTSSSSCGKGLPLVPKPPGFDPWAHPGSSSFISTLVIIQSDGYWCQIQVLFPILINFLIGSRVFHFHNAAIDLISSHTFRWPKQFRKNLGSALAGWLDRNAMHLSVPVAGRPALDRDLSFAVDNK